MNRWDAWAGPPLRQHAFRVGKVLAFGTPGPHNGQFSYEETGMHGFLSRPEPVNTLPACMGTRQAPRLKSRPVFVLPAPAGRAPCEFLRFFPFLATPVILALTWTDPDRNKPRGYYIMNRWDAWAGPPLCFHTFRVGKVLAFGTPGPHNGQFSYEETGMHGFLSRPEPVNTLAACRGTCQAPRLKPTHVFILPAPADRAPGNFLRIFPFGANPLPLGLS
jgi:hypothetical protein